MNSERREICNIVMGKVKVLYLIENVQFDGRKLLQLAILLAETAGRFL
jgi:hypothetical protein